jgi:SMC interacting uncharacterized protein involved in chromosome segregation
MTKLTAEELESIRGLQQFYNKTIFDIGKVSAQEAILNDQLDETRQEKDKLFKDLKVIEKQESELVKSLQEKYGSGNIDINTGEITPVQQ